MTFPRYVLLVFLGLNYTTKVSQAGTYSSAHEVIESFYKVYLNKKDMRKIPDLRVSASLKKEMNNNKKICKERAGTDICGWAGNGDYYLNAQEFKPESFEKSGLKVSDIGFRKILVEMNVYPSIKNDKGQKDPSYDRRIIFHMLNENGHWVVDDIEYEQGSLRVQIKNENDHYLRNSQSK